MGENALRVIEAVKARLAEIEPGLPAGVEVVTTYDRSGLIEDSIDTLRETLLQEMVVVSVVIFLFLLHARSALVPIITLPLAVLLAFVPMLYQGLTINIMSLGGIAVAIGAMVDAAVILIENIHKKLEDPRSGARRLELVIEAMQEVGTEHFLLSTRHHRLLLAGLHPRGGGGPACSSRSPSPRPTPWLLPRYSRSP